MPHFEESAVNPKATAEELMNSLIPFAVRILREYGEFLPFGGAMTSGGDIVHYGAKGATDRPRSSELISLLEEGFRAKIAENSVIAVALVLDVLIKPPGKSSKMDAIQIDIEHRDGYAVRVYRPYVLHDSEPSFDSTFACRKDLVMFTNS